MKKTTKKVICGVAALAGVMIAGVKIASNIQKKQCREDSKNPFEGKKVIFVENEEDPENADGVRGHLEPVSASAYTPSFYDKYVKRGLDIVLSFGGIVALSPILLGIAAAIKIDDPGPVFFTQKRLGQNKKYFRVYKFRSMKMSTPHDTPTHMLENPEQYITRVGKFLRAHSLDELPQLFNVLDGSLSLVGPRPGLWNQDVLTAERDKYGVNEYKPGITGWAQINGRDSISIEKKSELDGYGVRHSSLLFDLKCLLGTVTKVGHDDTVVEGGTGAMEQEETKLLSIAKCNENIDLTEKKKILIAGKNSYIGEKFKEYMFTFENYVIDTIDTRTNEWKNIDFGQYDVVYDVAGIAHIKETKDNRKLYYQVNRDLTLEIAKKAKKDGARQFVYLSSMSVYGKLCGTIDEHTKEKPVNAYGKSKLEAEQLLWKLNDGNFIVSIVRPPMVYGKKCKGNYQTLRNFTLKTNIFPKYENRRSMIYIDNLSSSIRAIIHNETSGIYFPQNVEYVRTIDMVRMIAEANNKKIKLISFFNPIIEITIKNIKVCTKVFGSLIYDQKLNVPIEWIHVRDFSETMNLTEKKIDNRINKRDFFSEKKIQVLLSSYNGQEYIREQIESIMKQTGVKRVDLLIRDDGSTDETRVIIDDLTRKYPNRIKCIYGSNIGYNGSFFELINNAGEYDYYAFSDQDDVWLSNKLFNACKRLEYENQNIPLLYGSQSYLVGDDLIPYGMTRSKVREFTIYNTLVQNICPGHTQVFNNALLERLKIGVDVSKIYVYDSWITNIAMLYGKICFDNHAYTYYRQHYDNSFGSGTGKVGQLISSIKHAQTGDGPKYRKQIRYFAEMNKEELKKKGCYDNIVEFTVLCGSRFSLNKVKNVFQEKFFRQRKIETLALYLAIILGRY